MKRVVSIGIAVVLLISLSCFAGYILNDRVKYSYAKEEEEAENIYKPSTPPKTTVADALIRGVGRENRLITTEVTLKCSILIDDSYFDMEIFKKQQTINYYANAIFTVNTGGLKKEDIIFSEDEKSVTVYAEKTRLENIALEEDKTVINKTETGFLRFGDIKIGAEDYNEVMKKASDEFFYQVGTDEILKLAEENSSLSLKELFSSVLSGTEYADYKISVEFKP